MTETNNCIIASHYCPGESNCEAALLSRNLLQWGDWIRNSPHWIFELNERNSKEPGILALPGIEKITVEITKEILDTPFAAKVIAAAEAESRAELLHIRELIWVDPDTLFIQDPAALSLEAGEKIILTPVHVQNIGSAIIDPPDKFWKLVYSHCHVNSNETFQVTSMIDQVKIRAYFNAGLISVDPHTGILRRWRDNFLSLLQNPVLETFCQSDFRYKVFIHQAIFSATILETCRRDEIRLLLSEYNFPLHLVNRIAVQDRPACLENLVTVRYDDFNEPGWSTILPTSEPLRTWLSNAIAEVRNN